jgi:phosphatidylglycerol:prolipoprotein diacylglycerol transferase
MLLVFALLFYLHKKKKFDGQILILYGLIYSVFRFSVEFVRDDPRGDLFGITSMTGLSTSQVIALIVAIGSAYFLYTRSRKTAETL